MTHPSPNYKNKYYPLIQPIVIPRRGDIPETTYSYLYIHQVDSYLSEVGDVDFVLQVAEYNELKNQLLVDEFRLGGLRIFERAEENMIEMWRP